MAEVCHCREAGMAVLVCGGGAISSSPARISCSGPDARHLDPSGGGAMTCGIDAPVCVLARGGSVYWGSSLETLICSKGGVLLLV